jgi:hypothetical protein
MKNILLTFVAAATVMACSGKKAVQPQAELPAAPVQQTTSSPKHEVPVQGSAGQLIGTVLETREAAGYTYVRLQTPAGERWAAVSQTKVTTGETVKIDVQMVANNFESKTLNRKFDAIAFGTIAARPAAEPPQPAMMSSTPASAPSRPAGTAAQHMTAPDVPSVTVPRAEARDAKTVAELLTGNASLDGQSVTVRATVVKSLTGIMGKNWLHLRDGSRAGGKEADLTVTTDAVAAVGDVVTVKGKVSIDKDFGAGYRYPVIIENADVSK